MENYFLFGMIIDIAPKFYLALSLSYKKVQRS